jgi:hypothetical protein
VTMARTGAPIPGAVITPRPLPLSAVHPSLPRRVVEISGLPPDTLVRIGMAGEDCTVLTPPAPDGELRVLMGSCFYLPDDRGKLASAYESLRDQDRPHLRRSSGRMRATASIGWTRSIPAISAAGSRSSPRTITTSGTTIRTGCLI